MRTKKIMLLFSALIPFLTQAEEPALTVVRKTYGAMSKSAFLAFLEGTGIPGFFEGRGTPAILLLTLLGGMALNLTPCVLPMIPVNLSIIGAGKECTNRRIAILRAAVYSAGIAIAYGTIGVISALGLARLGGLASQWYFNLGAALIFFLLGLAMFDVFFLDFSRFRTGFRTAETLRWTGVFLLGVLAAVLAGACVAPVVIAVMLQSAKLYSAGHFYGMLLPFLLGLGMGLPWPVLAAGIARLPRPGQWMKHVKHAFGILILATACFYAWTAWNLFAGGKESGNDLTTLGEAGVRAEASGKLIFVDFHADWCKNCKAMEHTVLQDPEVRKTLRNFIVVRFDATNTDSPEVRNVLDRYGIKGLPAYLILEAKKNPADSVSAGP